MIARHERGQWRTPAALWDDAADDAPVLLRFDSDDFMTRLLDTLATDPAGVAGYVAAAETWREPRVGLAAAAADSGSVLPLYQPAQQRFYAVAATLACPRYGLPDLAVDASQDESVGFVVRRVDERGEAGLATDGTWRATPAGRLVADEEIHPLVALSHAEGERTRRVLVGLVPVSARERLAAGGTDGSDASGGGGGSGDRAPEPLDDPRIADLVADVVVPLQQVLEATDDPGIAGLRESVFFAALDLAGLLERERADAPSVGLDQLLAATFELRGGRPIRWRDALAEARAAAATTPRLDFDDEDAPRPVRTATAAELRAAVGRLGIDGDRPPDREELVSAVTDALRPPRGPDERRRADERVAAPVTAPTRDPEAEPEADPEAESVYVLRCVHRRPRCPAPLDVTLSAPSRPVRFAGFFDPGAPARPVRIPLPGDTSLQSLRRSPKAVSVLLSRQLKEQLSRAASELDAPDGSPSGSIEWVMQLSIPIISICALVLLSVTVSLLHIVFWWLPAFVRWVPRFRVGGDA